MNITTTRRGFMGVAVGSAATAAYVRTSRAQTMEKVKLAYVPEMNAAILFAAAGHGFFNEVGIDLELVRVNSSIDAAAFLASGELDGGSLGLSAGIFNAINRGFDMKIVGTAASWGREHSVAIVANAAAVDAGLALKSLAGKRLAVAGGAGSGGSYIANAALQTVGMSILDVQLVNLPNSDMPVAIKNNAIDAGQVGVPYSVVAIKEGWGKALITNWEPGLSNTQYFFSGKFLRERRSVALKVFQALLMGSRSIQGPALTSDENLKIFERYLNAPRDAILLAKPLVYSPDLAVAKDSVLAQERFHREIRYSDYSSPLPFELLIDPSIQIDALKAAK